MRMTLFSTGRWMLAGLHPRSWLLLRVAWSPCCDGHDRRRLDAPLVGVRTPFGSKSRGPFMIEAGGLTKRYRDRLAGDGLSSTVRPGQVTGFLGPNGAGKSTTMRMILGLDAPTSGTVTVSGKRFVELANPMREVGALLDAKAIHGGRTAYHHLLCLAQS